MQAQSNEVHSSMTIEIASMVANALPEHLTPSAPHATEASTAANIQQRKPLVCRSGSFFFSSSWFKDGEEGATLHTTACRPADTHKHNAGQTNG